MTRVDFPTLHQITRNIRAWIARATPEQAQAGEQWYFEAHHWCRALADESGVDFPRVVGVLAALSPSTTWERNQADARAMVLGYGAWSFTTYGVNVERARRILVGELSALSGQKVTAFADCIANPHWTSAVCVDRHAYSLATGLQEGSLHQNRFDLIATAYRRVAQQFGIKPHQAQAIAWVTYREDKRS